MRDHNGNWLWGFTVNIGYTDMFTAELWGLREGPRLLDGKGISKVVIKLDSEAVIMMIKEGMEMKDSRSVLVQDCIEMARRNKFEIFHHVFCECNKCVDWLANLGQSGNWGTTIWKLNHHLRASEVFWKRTREGLSSKEFAKLECTG